MKLIIPSSAARTSACAAIATRLFIGLALEAPAIHNGAWIAALTPEGKELSSEEFARQLLEAERVAVIPGNAFGPSGEGFVRCSYATSLKQIQTALERIGRFLERLKKK